MNRSNRLIKSLHDMLSAFHGLWQFEYIPLFQAIQILSTQMAYTHCTHINAKIDGTAFK